MAYKERDNKWTRLWISIAEWRERHIKERNFLVMLALVVGVLCGFAAQLLKLLIHLISSLLTSGIDDGNVNYWYLVFPVVGILIVSVFIRYVVKDDISHGVTRVLYAISRRKSRLKKKNIYASLVASSVTIGFGGSVGAEGPIVFTGAAIGSNIGQAFRLSPKILMILVGCGAAAGIAGIFRAPIAGMLFTIEVLMIDLTAATVMPLIISSVSAATVAYVLEGYTSEFFFAQSEPFLTGKIPYTILLGIFCGFISLYFTRCIFGMETFFKHIHKRWVKILVGGIILAVLIFLFPSLYGEGYDTIDLLLEGDVKAVVNGTFFYLDRNNVWVIAGVLSAIVLLKVFATSATNGAGGVGGTFAPSLFVGALAGFLFAYVFNELNLGVTVSEKNFALMGMAGVMSGVMHAPLMAIFLTAEMTGGYDLFLPLLIVSSLAYMTIRIFEPYSIYTMRLAKHGDLLTHHKDKAVLTMLNVDELIERDFKSVTPDMTLKQVVDTIATSTRNLFPVVDAENNLVGVVLLDDIRNIMFRPDLYKKMHVRRFMSMPPDRIDIHDSMENVMRIFDKTNAWNLPVVDGTKYVGFVSKSKIFNSYRKLLRHYSDD
ncbi:MAG TPA: chloride channel protein [Porphyromonadaceae bacterium]|nr:chloride channel protein [Porphyromonadaceae bacterium]